ncbi:MAG: hypothetical protein GSR85_05640, partial [Desulfurococcales archaeon]|nr:hypothetical protein [Desulfurococcales archaeon]
MSKPLFENIGIGTIIKRIGECNALSDDYSLSILLTQQTPREDECKDLCIAGGSKLVVIDFKAPVVIDYQMRRYKNVRTRVSRLGNIIGLNNIFLGLLHAALKISTQCVINYNKGYFMHMATPLSTVFVPLSEFNGNSHTFQKGTLYFGNIDINEIDYNCIFCNGLLKRYLESESLIILKSMTPTCCSIRNNLCFNTIGFSPQYCDFCYDLCEAKIEVKISSSYATNSLWINGFTLSYLLWLIRSCKIGYHIRGREDREKIIEELLSLIGDLESAEG